MSRHAAAPASLDGFLAGIEARALRMAQLTTRDADEALDCVQDAMIALARHYAAKPPAEWPPLFYRILDHRLRKWRFRQLLRGRWLGRRVQGGDDADDPLDALPAPEAERPEAAAQREETLRGVQRALRTLPERQRQAFLLRHWQGLSTADTAAAMQCTEGSVKTHLSRALGALQAQLAPQGITP